jgi:hypothetical protein
MEKEISIWSQYAAQSEQERSVRKTVEFDMRYYQKRAEFSKGQIMLLQFELEIQEDKLKKLKSHYLMTGEELIRNKQVLRMMFRLY